MKRKLGLALFLCLFAFLLTSCDEVLSVVTADKDGKKVVNNYVSMFANTVYDESISLKTWRNIELFKENETVDMDSLLFKIENKKENLVVLGDEKSAIEIRFFEGGYKYRLFSSMEELNRMFKF